MDVLFKIGIAIECIGGLLFLINQTIARIVVVIGSAILLFWVLFVLLPQL